jgi:purine-nucleoside phosphorylase
MVNKNYYSLIMLCIYLKESLTNSYVENICKMGSKGSVVIVLIINKLIKSKSIFSKKKKATLFLKSGFSFFTGEQEKLIY